MFVDIVDVGLASHSVIEQLAWKADAFSFVAKFLGVFGDFEFTIDRPTVGKRYSIVGYAFYGFHINQTWVLVTGFILISAFAEHVIKKR